MEFIDTDHTPKNILIRGVKTKKEMNPNYRDLVKKLSLEPTLMKLTEDL